MMKTHMISERGNILFLILLAVVLFAALGYAVMSGMQGGGKNATTEKAQINQAVIDNFSAQISAAALRLQTTNNCQTVYYTPPSEQSPSGDKSCYIFNPGGGNVPWLDIGYDGCAASGGSLTSLAVGEVCANMVYVGTSSGRRLYAMANGLSGTSILWYSGTSSVSTDNSNGATNTDNLIADGGASYAAAALCRALGSKWFLPAYNEIGIIYTNRNSNSLNVRFGNPGYWTSTRMTTTTARAYNVSNGGSNTPAFNVGQAVLCMRYD